MPTSPGDRVNQQRLAALTVANAARSARSELKHRVAAGEISVAAILRAPPPAAQRCSVKDLLISQRHWGRRRTQKLLDDNAISETKLIAELTTRQRELLAHQLDPA